jgi:hypothetical protein
LTPSTLSDLYANPTVYYSEALGDQGLRSLAFRGFRYLLVLSPNGPDIVRTAIEAMPRDERSMAILQAFVRFAADYKWSGDVLQWFANQIVAYPVRHDDPGYELMRFCLMAEALSIFPAAAPDIARLLNDSGLLSATAGPLEFTVGCRVLAALTKCDHPFPSAAVFPLLQHPAECVPVDLILAVEAAVVEMAHPDAVSETIAFLMERILQISVTEGGECDNELMSYFHVIARLFAVPGHAPHASVFCAFWRECFQQRYFKEIPGFEFLCTVAGSIIKNHVPGAFEVLELTLNLLSSCTVHNRTKFVALPGWKVNDLGKDFDLSIGDLVRVIILALWASGDEIREWTGRGILIELIMGHFIRAFGPELDELYDDVERYFIARATAQIIALRWISEVDIIEAFRRTCDAVLQIDPAEEFIAFNGVINIMAAIGTAEVFTVITDFPERCVAFLKGEGIFDRNSMWVMEQLLNACATENPEAVHELRLELSSTKITSPEKEARELGLIAEIVGWREMTPA